MRNWRVQAVQVEGGPFLCRWAVHLGPVLATCSWLALSPGSGPRYPPRFMEMTCLIHFKSTWSQIGSLRLPPLSMGFRHFHTMKWLRHADWNGLGDSMPFKWLADGYQRSSHWRPSDDATFTKMTSVFQCLSLSLVSHAKPWRWAQHGIK